MDDNKPDCANATVWAPHPQYISNIRQPQNDDDDEDDDDGVVVVAVVVVVLVVSVVVVVSGF